MSTPRRLRLGMVGGGQGAFIGAVHRIAARIDDQYELVAGAFSSDPGRGAASADALRVAPNRSYADVHALAKAEAGRADGVDVVAIVTPNYLHHAAARALLDAGIAVICDKPLVTNFADARNLLEVATRTKISFVVTHAYTGYPMVREARALVASGAIGAVRLVQVEYVQDWLSGALETTGNKQADWRTDPARSGPSGAVGDVGTHAHNLAEFVAGCGLRRWRQTCNASFLAASWTTTRTCCCGSKAARAGRCGAARSPPATRTGCWCGCMARPAGCRGARSTQTKSRSPPPPASPRGNCFVARRGCRPTRRGRRGCRQAIRRGIWKRSRNSTQTLPS